MGWARLDDGFHDHPKLIGLPLDALGLWTKCFTWAHRHQGSSLVLGHIPAGLPTLFAGTRGPKLAALLVAHRLWEIEENIGGWLIHDYSDYLPATERPATADEVRKARSDAGKRGAKVRWQNANEQQQVDGKLLSDVDGKPMPPTRPDPTYAISDEMALPPKRRREPQKPLPDDWRPNAKHADMARTRRVNLEVQAEAFRNHALSVDRRAARWDAAFNTWLLKALPDVRAVNGRPDPDAWMNR